eukprot:PhF_6_TR12245/c0_g1_i1/m.19390/K00025/MDH1; malate dehydrogenase
MKRVREEIMTQVPFPKKDVVSVLLTGAAGQIGYSLGPMIASGAMLGPNQKIRLVLLDLEAAKNGMEALRMELIDSVYPSLVKVEVFTDSGAAFVDCDIAIMCGAFPRLKGMERADLLIKNKDIFKTQGQLMVAAKVPSHCRVLVVGNPANTNALILATHSGDVISPQQVTALTRLDQNRATAWIANHFNVPTTSVSNVLIWGNHSNTQVPDVTYATIKEKGPVTGIAVDAFMSDVRKRGAEVIAVRGLSSATSAARAIVEHMRDWILGTAPGVFVSMGVYSNGNPFGVPDNLIYSMPCTCQDGVWKIPEGIAVAEGVKKFLEDSTKELVEERTIALA